MKFANPLFQRIVRLATALLLGAAVIPAALAQAEADPPGRVGRLADLTGKVWLFSQESGDWVEASRNMPLTAGDRLSTDAGARAEVRIGSTALRLDSGSELEVLRLDDERMSLQLHNGSLAARLRNREAANEFDLKTAEGQFTVQRAGRYRFDRTDGTSHLTVYTGQSLYEGPRSALTVNSGQHAEFWIDAADAAQYSITEPQQDAFAAWNNERDRSDDRSVSARYVSPEMTGVEDLDRNGRWEQSPEYGPLWIPRSVAPGWAPYSSGHWAWVRPWGWTWVDDAAWGFAPFHYGRWVWRSNVWCWAPGTYVARPVYAPALVAWVGGPSLSVSLSIGGGFAGPAVGWFPLGPREVFVPSYRYSPRYVREVNITHVTNITNVINVPIGQRDFSNRKFPHAVTVVPTSVMTGRQPVGPASAQLRDAPAVREFVREQGRHGALQDAPVAAPVVVARAIDRRPGPPPGPAGDGRRDPAPTDRAGRPGQRGEGDGDRNRDRDRSFGPSARQPVPANTAPVNTPPAVVARPPVTAAPSTVPPPAATVMPPVRQVAPSRPARGDTPDAVAAQPRPAPVPTPQVRGRANPEAGQDNRDNRTSGNPPVAAPQAPQAPTARAAPVERAAPVVPVERAMPDKRHHGEPPAAPRAVPADGPEHARAQADARQERDDRRPQRDRSNAN